MDYERLSQDVQQEGAEGLAAMGINSASLAAINQHKVKNDMFFKRMTKAFPIANLPFMIEDGLSGYSNTGKVYGVDNPDWKQTLASTLGGLANGASLGIIPADKAALGLYSGGRNYIPPKQNK